MQAIWILILATLISPAIQAEAGHATNNGGGVVCIGGVCKTLSESGLKLSPEYSGVWIPKAEHFKEVKENVQNNIFLPGAVKERIGFNTFGRVDEFRKVDIVDPERLEAIRQHYLEVAKEAGTIIDPITFKVVAISSDDTVQPALTYLLPGFFELTTEQQSSILFHEGLYRGRPTDKLKYILQFESAISQVSQSMIDHHMANLRNRIDEAILAYRLEYISKKGLIGIILSQVIGAAESRERAEDLAGRFPIYSNSGGYDCVDGNVKSISFDARKLLDLALFGPRLPYMFSQVNEIQLEAVSFFGNMNSVEVDWKSSGEPYFLLTCEVIGRASSKWYQLSEAQKSIDLILPE